MEEERGCLPGRRLQSKAQQWGSATQRPNYPTTIQFDSSQDDRPSLISSPFDEQGFDDLGGLSLNEISLEDTFGFEKNPKDDDIFERLYTGNEEDGDGTLGQSSIGLNSYSPIPRVGAKHIGNQKKQMHQNARSQATTNQSTQQRGRDSIFRSHNNNSSSGPVAQQQTSNNQLVSPTTAMDRRRSTKPQTSAQPSPSIMSPNSSFFKSTTSSGASSSIRRNNTGNSSRSRHRSTSRSHRSRSRGTSHGRRRSRSRSTSVAPKKEDPYHQSLFRGAALIREQLLRSMASADQAMDEAEREFMEEMIERGGKQQSSQAARHRLEKHNRNDGNGDIDHDYSFDREEGGGAKTGLAPSPSRGNGVRVSASQDSAALESEGKRLDNLMSIFGATSSTSSASDKENGVEARIHTNHQGTEIVSSNVISPTSTLGLTSPISHMRSSNHNSGAYNEYASRYLHEDAPKPIVGRTFEQATNTTKRLVNADRNEHRHQNHPPAQVDEALAHAQGAGPLWRSLVGNHVRFPSQWETLLSPKSPPIHRLNHTWSKWYYIARHRVKGDKRLNSREYGVRSRRSGGRILMRLLVREMHSQHVSREIAIGCFHPNSKGIRRGDPLPEAEDVREVWMAVRWSTGAADHEPILDLRREGNDYEGVVDNFLMQKRKSLDYGTMGSALGYRKAVNNENIRAVFGDQPPMTTVDLHEDEIAEILKANGTKKLAVLPALMLLKLFLFSN